MKKGFFLLLVTSFLASCGLSEADVQATIAALPTQTSASTATATPEPTLLPTATPTPDLRVIDTDPYNLLLSKDDLPSEARYYLPASDWISPHRNSEIISGRGVDAGSFYLAETRRIDGWWAEYRRGTSTVLAPLGIYSNVVLYETADGAALMTSKYGNCVDTDLDFQVFNTDFSIGDSSNVCIDREMQSNGENYVYLIVEFVYRNVFHAVIAHGYEREVKAEYLFSIAETAYSKLLEAPLSNEVSFSP